MITRSHARRIRRIIELAATSLADSDALDAPEVFPVWNPYATYSVGDRVRHGDALYRCLQAHGAQAQWSPDQAPSLWARVLIPDPDVVPEWVQPDSTNPYMSGDRVTHNGQTWESTVDNNVWEPGVYGWSVVG